MAVSSSAGPCPELRLMAAGSCRGQGSVYGFRCCALADERFLGAHYAELVIFRVGKDSPGFSAGLSDVYPARPEREKAVNLLIAIGGAGGEVKMHAILDSLGIGDRHKAHADRCVLVGPDHDLVLALRQHLPAKRLGPEPGQARQVVSVNHDVVESYGHVASMRGARDPYLPNRALRRLPIVTQFVFGGRRTVRASFVAGLFGGPAFQIPAAPGEVL